MSNKELFTKLVTEETQSQEMKIEKEIKKFALINIRMSSHHPRQQNDFADGWEHHLDIQELHSLTKPG